MSETLSPDLLLAAYCQGIFPMAHEDGAIYWYDPDPRAIIHLDSFRISRSLARLIKQAPFDIRIDTAFAEVIKACARRARGREETWISEEIVQAYGWLHRLGYAHSVEAWQDGALVGGLYGVAIKGLFAGESMFSQVSNSSKVALVNLWQHLRQGGFYLLDVQFMTPHLRQFGAVEIPADEYKRLLARALQIPARFGA